MKCFCIAKNITTGGMAASIEPALIRCHDATHWPCSAARPLVTGLAKSFCTSTRAQK